MIKKNLQEIRLYLLPGTQFLTGTIYKVDMRKTILVVVKETNMPAWDSVLIDNPTTVTVTLKEMYTGEYHGGYIDIEVFEPEEA